MAADLFLDKEGLFARILHIHSYFSCWEACNFIWGEGTQSFAIPCLETAAPLD